MHMNRGVALALAALAAAACQQPAAPASAGPASPDVAADLQTDVAGDTVAADESGAAEVAPRADVFDGAEAQADTGGDDPTDGTHSDSDTSGETASGDASASAEAAGEADAEASEGDGGAGSDAGEVAAAPADTGADSAAADAAPDATLDAKPLENCGCGNAMCESACSETPTSCPSDCKLCGDGLCTGGESPTSCAKDCCGTCGDKKCGGLVCGETAEACPADCGAACPDGQCSAGETPLLCPADCKWKVCGNGVCEVSDGGAAACAKDCAPTCGNCLCEKGEDYLGCPSDCGYCGDGVCKACAVGGESPATCPADCHKPECVPGATQACNDGNPCTADSCGPSAVCLHIPAKAACDEGNPCTVGDACSGGVCLPGVVSTCADAEPCTTDGCDAVKGCVHLANTLKCDDGEVCTTQDWCSGGSCGGALVPCGDGDPCTVDSCQPGLGCVHTPGQGGACNDGDACTQADVCAAGLCKGSTVVCDDAEPCTDDSCIPATGCVHMANKGPCSDASVCTIGEHCADGMCAGEPVDCNDGNLCTLDACNAKSGCVHVAWQGACSDSNPCTLADTCKQGSCVGSPMLYDTLVAPQNGIQLGNIDAVTDSAIRSPLGLAQTGDGGFAVVALAKGPGSWLVRMGPSGGVNWQTTLGSLQEPTRPFDVATATDDSLVVVGDRMTADGIGTLAWMARADAKGGVLWNAGFGFPKGPGQSFRAVAPAGGGQWLAAGRTTSKGAGNWDAWLVRVDDGGTLVSDFTVGGPKADMALDMRAVSAGGFVVTGVTGSSGYGDGDMWLFRLASNGDVLWQVNLGVAGYDDGRTVTEVVGGGFAVVGHTDSGKPVRVVRTNAQGKLLFEQGLGGAGPGQTLGAIAGIADGGVVLAGGRILDDTGFWLQALDAAGNVGWSSDLPWPKAGSLAYDLVVRADGGLLVAGVAKTGTGAKLRVLHADAWGHPNCASSGVCAVTPVLACDDGNPCTIDACGSAGGCSHAALADGTACGINGCSLDQVYSAAVCAAGICNATVLACNDGNPCTTDACSAATGCSHGSKAWTIADYKGASRGRALAANGTNDWLVAGESGLNAYGYGGQGMLRKISLDGQLGWLKGVNVGGFGRIGAAIALPTGDWMLGGTGGKDEAHTDAVVVRADATGNVAWTKYFGGADLDVGNGIAQGGDGTSWLVGATRSKGNGGWDGWLVRVNGSGALAGEATMGGAGDDQLLAVAALAAGAWVVGRTAPKGSAAGDGWLVRLTGTGGLAWQKTLGGPGDDDLRAVRSIATGAIAGGSKVGAAGDRDAWVVRTDADGAIVWQQTYGGKGDDVANAVVDFGASGVAFAGSTTSLGAGLADIWVVRLDAAGNVLWQHTAGDAFDDMAWALEGLPGGGLLVAGETFDSADEGRTAWIARADAWGHFTCASAKSCALKSFADCDDGDPCTADSCADAVCTHLALPAGSPCGAEKTCAKAVCSAP